VPDPIQAALDRAAARQQTPKELPRRTELAPETPAARLNHMIADKGPEAVETALAAWDARTRGESYSDIAHSYHLSIEGAKTLIREAYQAIGEDLKDALSQNRALDLARIDGLLQTYYPMARAGDDKAATLVLKAIERRARLCGTEPEPVQARVDHSQNILVWVQQQLPNINRLVDSLPPELAPAP
jgi:hypothetical protein